MVMAIIIKQSKLLLYLSVIVGIVTANNNYTGSTGIKKCTGVQQMFAHFRSSPGPIVLSSLLIVNCDAKSPPVCGNSNPPSLLICSTVKLGSIFLPATGKRSTIFRLVSKLFFIIAKGLFVFEYLKILIL